ncbi:hypothetical protein INT46_003366 [Mucor plumbeus]|uniref:Uncharacterized protein n=1 Tax=Mucor plumbeus TaxID=97098 RepID=A0A8H7V0J2_9FUNG|nr:hypothetical protein INT46_003366 [Mucor plumbeus]
MNSQKGLPAIDNNLYQLHIDLQLRQLENDASVRLNEKEKLKTILTSLRGVNGNILHSIFREIFDNSVDLRDADNHVEQMDFETILENVQNTNIAEKADIESAKPKENLEHADTSGQIKEDEGEKIIEVPKAKQRNSSNSKST